MMHCFYLYSVAVAVHGRIPTIERQTMSLPLWVPLHGNADKGEFLSSHKVIARIKHKSSIIFNDSKASCQ